MSKRIRILLITTVIIVVAVLAYYALTYQSPEDWLKDYLSEVYGGEQWLRIGEDGKYYAQFANLSEVKYEDGLFKAEKTYHELCLQPDRNYYEGDDIYITPEKTFYKYDENEISFIITNNSSFQMGGLPSQHNSIDFIGFDAYDIDVNVNGQWYAVFLGLYTDRFKSSINEIEANKIYAMSIPADIFGINRFSVDKSGNIHFIADYFKLRPGVYRMCKK